MAAKKNRNRAAALGAAQVQSLRGTAAMGEAERGGQLLAERAAQYANAARPEHLAGRLAEEMHAASGSVDAAVKGLSVRFRTTESLGAPHAAADIVAGDDGRILRNFQSKYSRSTPTLVRELSDPKYRGMGKLAPAEMTDKVRKTAAALAKAGRRPDLDLSDTAKRVSGRVSAGGASSRPLSNDEAMLAATVPQRAARAIKQEAAARAFAATAALSGAAGALAAAMQGGNAKTVAKAAATSAAFGVAHQAATHAVARAGTKVLGQAFAKSGAAGAVAGAAIGIAGDSIEFAKGNVSGKEFAERSGKHGVRAGAGWAGAKLGAALGSFFGPPGSAIGGLLGGIFGAMAGDSLVS